MEQISNARKNEDNQQYAKKRNNWFHRILCLKVLLEVHTRLNHLSSVKQGETIFCPWNSEKAFCREHDFVFQLDPGHQQLEACLNLIFTHIRTYCMDINDEQSLPWNPIGWFCSNLILNVIHLFAFEEGGRERLRGLFLQILWMPSLERPFIRAWSWCEQHRTTQPSNSHTTY